MPNIEQARAWYRQDDPVHGFDHILRVLALADRIARAEGADVEIVSAAALLHDASGGDLQENQRATHHEASADFARKILGAEGWFEERIVAVQNCIVAHRYRGGAPARSLEAQILYDADKLDVLGAFGIARTIAYAVQAGQPIYAKVSREFVQTGKGLEGEAHSVYHEYLFKLRKIEASLHTATAKRMAKDRVQVIDAFFEALINEAEIAQK